MLISENTEKPIIKMYRDAVEESQYMIEKLTKLKPIFESLKNNIDDITYGYINTEKNQIKFIYKDTIVVEIKYINEKLVKIESNFKVQKQAIRIPHGEGSLIINVGFNSTEDINYRIEKQITLKELDVNILDDLNKQTINVFQKTLNVDLKQYPQIKNTIWGLGM